jgi:hypothetical protein
MVLPVVLGVMVWGVLTGNMLEPTIKPTSSAVLLERGLGRFWLVCFWRDGLGGHWQRFGLVLLDGQGLVLVVL